MEVSLKEFAEKYNKVRTRRGHKMSQGYLYRLIRQHKDGCNTRELWFKYKFVGDKDSVRIMV